MSVLVVGLSHKSAPIATLERAAVGDDTLGKLLSDIVRLPDVAEAFVISTCNRVEVYADVDRFHGGVAGICELLSRYSGIPSAELTLSLYVHYEGRAVQHLLSVASGLDSVVVGEDQIIGQVRAAIRVAEENGTMGRVLRDLGRVALHAGKRARAETGIDRMGLSLVSVGIELALRELYADEEDSPGKGGFCPPPGRGVSGGRSHPEPGGQQGGRPPGEIQGRPPGKWNVLVVGAGTMSGLAVATAARLGADRVVVANRTLDRARRLAASVDGEVADVADLAGAIAGADLVISCTGASGLVVTEAVVRDALSLRAHGAPLALLDLAMPRDVDPAVAALPGVSLIGLDRLSSEHAGVGADDLSAVRAIVDDEFAAYGSAVRAAQVAPTVVALRAKAATVVDAELVRLEGRLSDEGLSGHALEEIARTVRRVVDKLLHAPTVRVKELASAPGGEDYAVALRVLFDLDPRAIEAVTRAETDPLNSADQEGEE
ncbi:MAG TPA: glutamyl-tRNA reductase [Trebonia sp.]|jgi:glutamyl-tRNA reductase|nr:glutamyl-tRNA reductase [Trebonia sp.]